MDSVLYNERQYVMNSFKKHFNSYCDVPMVIYGLGKNTGMIVEKFSEFNIVGLMDETRAGETVYGKKVITMQEALKSQVKIIVIIARAANVPIIYRRIADECKKADIDVFDINGEKLNVVIEPLLKLPKEYDAVCLEKIKAEILQADVVSFDIFDTLLMRTILYPRDLFRILERMLTAKYGKRFVGFADRRIAAEQRLYETCQPSLVQIYAKLKESYDYSEMECKRIMQEEIDTEKSVLIPRTAVVSLLQFAKESGKKIYLTSDMYMQKDTIIDILKQNNIDILRDQILVSNEEGCAKYNGLFNVLKKKALSQNILHIGDNVDADIVCAQKAGIKHVFWIPSSIKMTEDGKLREVLNRDDTLEDRCIIGMFLAAKLNDPFLYEKTKGKIVLEKEYELGRYFMAPLLYAFINWMIDTANADGIDEMLLSSRDGYIVKKILDSIQAKYPERIRFKYRYFYASRSVCLLAGLRNEKDILYAAGLAFAGNDEDLLIKRFHLKKEEIIERGTDEDRDIYFLKHKDLIMKNAKAIRDNYYRYLERNFIFGKRKYGFFDFVSSGTCQMGVVQFTKWDITGYYVSKFFDEHKANLKIKTFYPAKCVYEKQQALMDHYLFMENVYTSFEPTLETFDSNGNPIFMEEIRSQDQIMTLKEIHKGIEDGCNYFLKIDPELSIKDYQFADLFLKLLHREYTIDNTNYFFANPLRDEFCNRQFEVSN